ncbi:MAG: hypothetical protein E7399_09190 [Ruminococcaceae bacterium]|nr:hypothetical protein [Oscillospiraceae bacterium]
MIRDMAKGLNFPEEATAFLGECFDKITALEDGNDQLALAMDAFFASKDYASILNRLAEQTGIHRYSVDMVFLLLCADSLHDIYYIKELPEELFHNTMMDLKCKLLECKALHGIWGTFVTDWLQGYFHLKRYALGRLQYNTIEFPYEDYKGILKKGDRVLSCHIPSGAPLLIEDVLDSLKQAYAFYPDELRDGVLPITCHSWLLYAPHYEVFPEHSNLRKFYDLFTVIDNEATEGSNLDRIFNVTETDDYSTLAETTTLQKRFKKYLMDGNVMGEGFGILLFDGEKIL